MLCDFLWSGSRYTAFRVCLLSSPAHHPQPHLTLVVLILAKQFQMSGLCNMTKISYLLGVGLSGPKPVLHDNQAREAETVTNQNTGTDLQFASPAC